MNVKKIYLISGLLFSLFSIPASVFANADEVMLNNEAAGYVDTIESFIRKAGSRCEALLEKDAGWKDSLLSNWLSRNRKYSDAIDNWTNTYLDSIDRNYGSGLSQYEEQKILSVIEMRGKNFADEIITGDNKEKQNACIEFEQKVINGELDINQASPFYQHLEKMTNMY